MEEGDILCATKRVFVDKMKSQKRSMVDQTTKVYCTSSSLLPQIPHIVNQDKGKPDKGNLDKENLCSDTNTLKGHRI